MTALFLPYSDPLALFADESRIRFPVPAPVDFLFGLRLPLLGRYPTDEMGRITDPDCVSREYEVFKSTGEHITTLLNGSQKYGLPSIFDLDQLLLILLHVERFGASDDGRVAEASIGRISEGGTTSKVVRSSHRSAQLWRALQRWAHFTRADTRHREARDPDGQIVTESERERAYSVLSYDTERGTVGGKQADFIHDLRINPQLLQAVRDGFSAYVDVPLHTNLRSPAAKALHMKLLVQVAQSWQARDPQVYELRQLISEIGLAGGAKPAKQATRLKSPLTELKDAGIISAFGIESPRRGSYEIWIDPGPNLQAIERFQHVSGSASPLRSVLAYQLREAGIPKGDSEVLIDQFGADRIRTALRYRLFVLDERQGKDAKGRPIRSWSAWLMAVLHSDSIKDDDGDFGRWARRQVQRLAGRGREGKEAEGGVRTAFPTVSLPAPPDLPEGQWGAIVAAFGEGARERAWLCQATAEIEGSTLVVTAHNHLAEKWIRANCALALVEAAQSAGFEDVAEAVVRLQVTDGGGP